ncbi:MAG TPA: hypothetical protein VGM39_02050 [Kofleriaceae bacterium]|jgi:hypothetical protein
MKKLTLVLVVLGACASDSGTCGQQIGSGDDRGPGIETADDGCDQSGGTDEIAFTNFTAHTRSLGQFGGQYAVTDGLGPIACGLAQDLNSGLGSAGSSITLGIDPRESPCPVGTYSFHSAGCPLTWDGRTSAQDGCAYYRRWDDHAKMLGFKVATAGGLQISGTSSSCHIALSLSFDGQMFNDSTTLTADSGDEPAEPWCKQ